MLLPKSEWVGTAQISNLPAGDHDSPTVNQYLYAPLSSRELELLNILLQLSPPIVRLKIIFNRANVVLFGNLKTNRRFLSAKKPTFDQACEELYADIERKQSLPKIPRKKKPSEDNILPQTA